MQKKTSLINRLLPAFPIILVVLGLVSISVGFGVWFGLHAGLISLGVSCIILEWRVTG